MACTEAEWLRWLPAALGDAPSDLDQGCAQVMLGAGRLHLAWQPLPPRRLGLVRLPRLRVSFAFEDVALLERDAFMRRFDLYMQRGGG